MKQSASTRHVERQTWWRGPARVEGEWIVAYRPRERLGEEIRIRGLAAGWAVDSIEWEEYELYLSRGVPLALASVNDADTAAAFVTAYGFPHSRAADGRGREKVADILQAAEQIAGLIQLYGTLQKVAVGDAAGIGELRAWTPKIGKVLSRDPSRYAPPPWVQRGVRPTDVELVGYATICLSWLLDDGLELGDVRVRVAAASTLGRQSFTADEIDFVSRAKDLMGFVYYELAELMVARTPVRRCEGCPRFFEVTDPRKRFHDDRCRARHQMRRLRAQEKGHGRARRKAGGKR